jgi:hypothetical protein
MQRQSLIADVLPLQRTLEELELVKVEALAEALALAQAQAQEREKEREKEQEGVLMALVIGALAAVGGLVGVVAAAGTLGTLGAMGAGALGALGAMALGAAAVTVGATGGVAKAVTAAAVETAQARAQARSKAQAWARAKALVQALVQARAQARALEAEARARARPLMLEPMTKTFTYQDVLADPKLKKIIYSIKPDHRYSLAGLLRRCSQEYWWLIQIVTPITRLPTELLHQIFLVVIDETSHSPLVLMQVCKLWHTMVTGIWASLNLGTRTPKHAVTTKLKRNQRLLDVLVDTEIDRGAFTPSEGDYEAIFVAIEASSRWRSFVVKTIPAQASLSEDFVNRGLQQSSGAAMSHLRTFKLKCACEMSPLLDRLLSILGTSATEELTTIEINSPSVISFLVPTYSTIFHSVTTLSLDTPGLPNPVDLLPHLHQLETLTASHLSFPLYHNDTNLPFVHTLRHLSLRAVSIQWMSGRTFDALESCTLLFPLHRRVLHTFSTSLPNCKRLTFQGHPLDILDSVSAPNLTHLSVLCSCYDKLRGHRQLARFSSHTLRESRLAPRILHISIEATSQAWTTALGFMSNLEELVIDNAKPSSIGAKVLQSLIVQPIHTNNLSTSGGWNAPLASFLEQFGVRYRHWSQISTLERWDTPLCPSLKQFGLRYRRWLRQSEHFDLIPEFKSIIRSREQSGFSMESFRIWTEGDGKDPLELIEGSGISLKGFESLAKEGTTSGGNLL